MAVYTKLTNKDFLKIQDLFSIGKIINKTGIKKGIENTNYLIKTKKKKYILTIFEKRVNKKDVPFFMNLMSELYLKKVKCPNPIKNKKNKFFFNIKKKTGCLVSFLDGNEKKNLTSRDCIIIGKNIAKLHKITNKIKLYRKNNLSINSWPKLLYKIDRRINKLDKNLIPTLKNNLKVLKSNWPKKLPKGIIHSDLFIDNIFFSKRKFNGFIDFYFSCNDFYAYELSICINALCFKKKGKNFIYDRIKARNLIKGYQYIRKLTAIERENFNILCKGSALRYLLTRSYDYLNTPKSALIKIKDPKEYLQKLQFHQKLNLFEEYL